MKHQCLAGFRAKARPVHQGSHESRVTIDYVVEEVDPRQTGRDGRRAAGGASSHQHFSFTITLYFTMRRAAPKTQSLIIRQCLVSPQKRELSHGLLGGQKFSVRGRFHSTSSTSTTTTTTTPPPPPFPKQDDDHHQQVAPLLHQAEALMKASNVTDDQALTILEQLLVSDHPSISDKKPQLMFDILERWLKPYGQSNRTPKTTLPFELCLEACRQNSNGLLAAMVLDRWGYTLEGDIELRPTLDAFHIVFDSFRKHANREEAVTISLNIMEHIEITKSIAPTMLGLEVKTYALAMSVLASSQNTEEQLQSLLTKCRETYQQLDKTHPEDVYYLIQAHCLAPTKENFEQLLELMRPRTTTLSLFSSKDPWSLVHKYRVSDNEEPTEGLLSTGYEKAMRRLLSQGAVGKKREPALQVEELLQQTKKFTSHAPSLPGMNHYKLAFDCWSSLYNNDAALSTVERCEDLLGQMEERQESMEETVEIPLQLYERTLWMWKQTGRLDKMEPLFVHALELLSQKRISGPPSVATRLWNHFLHVLPDSRVLGWWGRMKQANVQPDGFTYVNVLKALSKEKTRANAVAKEADAILKDIKRRGFALSAAKCGSALICWSRSTERAAPWKARELLEEIERNYNKTKSDDWRPTPHCYTAAIAAWGRGPAGPYAVENASNILQRMVAFAQSDGGFRIDYVPYSAMINVLSRQKTVEAATRAEELLTYLESESEINPDLRPNNRCYTSCMLAWTRSGSQEGLDKTISIFKRLELAYKESGHRPSLMPDEYAYQALIDAFAKCARADAGDRCDEILEQMDHRALTDNRAPRPNKEMFTNAMMAHLRSRSPIAADRAQAILQTMKERDAEGDRAAKPDLFAMNTVIQAMVRSTSPDKAERAWVILREMCDASGKGDLDLRPTVVTFTAVLDCCAETNGDMKQRKRAIQIALDAMKTMQNLDLEPNSTLFATLLKMIGRQVANEDERFRFASSVFEQCCKSGQVNARVLNSLQTFAPKVYHRLPFDEKKQVKLQPGWTRMVEGGGRYNG
jgi:hypothetical protein